MNREERQEKYTKLSEMIQVDPFILRRLQYQDDELTTLFNTASQAIKIGKVAREELWKGCAPSAATAWSTDVFKAQSTLNRLAQSVNTRAMLMKAPPSEQKAEPSLEDTSPHL